MNDESVCGKATGQTVTIRIKTQDPRSPAVDQFFPITTSLCGTGRLTCDKKSNFVNSMRLLIAGNQIDCPDNRQFTELLQRDSLSSPHLPHIAAMMNPTSVSRT